VGVAFGRCYSVFRQVVAMAVGRRFMLILFHFSVFVMYSYTIMYETLYMPHSPNRKSYAGRFKFLTFWNQVRKPITWRNTVAGASEDSCALQCA